ncbi:ABC transporter ATP-binding protein [Candidatus Saccharibacteria bacterium]|nr:ABC transporter ATP-binding protein [Candidatus Saccharibacteria bacterium]
MRTIRAQKLTKTFGKVKALTDVSFEVKTGSITGFLGPNGAGKSTTMSILLGFINATSGEAHIFGRPVSINSTSIRRRIGFLANNMALDNTLTAAQEIKYFGKLADNYDETYVKELAERLSLDLTRKIGSLSTGNRQKVALITTLMHRPKLLILDEPTTGLDPIVRAEFHKIILEMQDAGTTVFISSHILSEIEELCDEFIFIKNGRIIATKTRDELTNQSQKKITIEAKYIDKFATECQRTFEDDIQLINKDGGVVTFTLTGDVQPLFKILTKYKVTNISIESASLEESFMEYYRDVGIPQTPATQTKKRKKKDAK